jgi:hypothetical protein
VAAAQDADPHRGMRMMSNREEVFSLFVSICVSVFR